MASGKSISGVYENDAGQRKVMTRKEFIRKLRLKGSGKGSAKPPKWHHARAS